MFFTWAYTQLKSSQNHKIVHFGNLIEPGNLLQSIVDDSVENPLDNSPNSFITANLNPT